MSTLGYLVTMDDTMSTSELEKSLAAIARVTGVITLTPVTTDYASRIAVEHTNYLWRERIRRDVSGWFEDFT
jgi:hypothetical protein